MCLPCSYIQLSWLWMSDFKVILQLNIVVCVNYKKLILHFHLQCMGFVLCPQGFGVIM